MAFAKIPTRFRWRSPEPTGRVAFAAELVIVGAMVLSFLVPGSELSESPRVIEAAVVPSVPQGADGAALLLARRPMIPVEGVAPQALRDHFDDSRGKRKHEAMDIMAPRGTRVFAVDDGKLAKLYYSIGGGITAYQYDPAGELTYYYAHLDRYADGLKEGMWLRRGELIGYVGSTGNAKASAPHLHFAVLRRGGDTRWSKGEPVNPYPALRLQADAVQAAR